MRIAHSGFYIVMSRQIFDETYISASFQQVFGVAMAQPMQLYGAFDVRFFPTLGLIHSKSFEHHIVRQHFVHPTAILAIVGVCSPTINKVVGCNL
jgi:hypothetical protein